MANYECGYGGGYHIFLVTFKCTTCNRNEAVFRQLKCSPTHAVMGKDTYMVKAVGCQICRTTIEMCFNCVPGDRDNWHQLGLNITVKNADDGH